jgi:hypothetical protein
MSISIYFHLSGYRTFKIYYKEHVSKVRKSYFPKLVSYNRFVELMQEKIIKQGDIKYYILEIMIFVMVSSLTWFISR